MKAILYARFSPRPNAGQCLSIETQLDRARRYCTQNDIEIVGEFQDAAVSGKATKKRPGLKAAMEAACALDGAGALVVYSLSRLARSTKDAISLAEQLDRAHANLISLTEKIDTTTAMGRAFFQILAVLAELERELTAERTKDAMRRHQEAGMRMSKFPPFGWVEDPNDPEKWTESPQEQAVIRIIMDMRGEGMGYRAIAAKLRGAGLPCRSTCWYHMMVKRIVARASREKR